METEYFFDVVLGSWLVVNFLHADIEASSDGFFILVCRKGHDLTLSSQLQAVLVLENLSGGIEAVHDRHLEVHYDGSIKPVGTVWIITTRLTVFKHIQGLLSVCGFMNLDFLYNLMIILEEVTEKFELLQLMWFYNNGFMTPLKIRI